MGASGPEPHDEGGGGVGAVHIAHRRGGAGDRALRSELGQRQERRRVRAGCFARPTATAGDLPEEEALGGLQERRGQSESVRQYINRSRRIEQEQESVGVRPAQMYDDEAKGNRLLERCRLPPDLARLTLVTSGDSLRYEDIENALSMQFPDFKPIPPVFYGTSFGGNRPSKGGENGKGSHQGSHYGQYHSKNRFGGKNDSKGKKQVYQAEITGPRAFGRLGGDARGR